MINSIWRHHSSSANRYLCAIGAYPTHCNVHVLSLFLCRRTELGGWEMKKEHPVLLRGGLESKLLRQEVPTLPPKCKFNATAASTDKHCTVNLSSKLFLQLLDDHFWVAVVLALVLLINLDLTNAEEQVSPDPVAAAKGLTWELVDQPRKKKKKKHVPLPETFAWAFCLSSRQRLGT